MSQRQLGSAVGYTYSHISRLENNRRVPDPAMVRALFVPALRLGGQADAGLAARLVELAVPSESGGASDAAQASDPGELGQVVPRQLPAPARRLAGRKRELGELTALLGHAADAGGTAVISAVGGTGGIGKTALAVYWAHRMSSRFPDGQLYANLRGFDPDGTPVTPAEVVRGFLDAFEVPPHRIPATADARQALYRSLLAERRVLLVLDNARDAGQVRPLLPGSATCFTIVTSRDRLAGLVAVDNARPITLDLLTMAEARELLTHRVGAERVAAEPRAAGEIIARCGRLPLALSIAAARAPARPGHRLSAIAAELRAGLDPLSTGDPAADMRAVMSWSYQALSVPAARLFRLLGLHPGPVIHAAAVASLAAASPDEARLLLRELSAGHMIEEPAPGRYALHDLLHAYALELLDGDEWRDGQLRLFDHYVRAGREAALLLDPERDDIGLADPPPGVSPERIGDRAHALAWFTAERPALLALARQADEGGFDACTWQLAWVLADYLDYRGHWHDLVTLQQAALRAAARREDRGWLARAHRGLARPYLRLDRAHDAHLHLTRALDMFGELGDRLSCAHTHVDLSRACELLGRPRNALEHAERALTLYRGAGHRVLEAVALGAAALTRLGDARAGHDLAGAREAWERAAAILEELGHPDAEAVRARLTAQEA